MYTVHSNAPYCALPTILSVLQLITHFICILTFQSMSLMKVTVPRDSKCSARTERRRVHDLSQARSTISGGNAPQLLEREVSTLNLADRGAILEGAGITCFIPAEQGLAIKADLALPWNKMRELRR